MNVHDYYISPMYPHSVVNKQSMYKNNEMIVTETVSKL